MVKKKLFHAALIFGCSLAFLFNASKVPEYEFPLFRIVIDPGHGGVSMDPKSLHGDRYDALSGTYLDPFKEGAARGRDWEHKIVYQIARKAYDILYECSPDGDFKKFNKILKKYSNARAKRIFILPMLSRGDSITRSEAKKMKEPNAEYRLFDFPGKDKKTMLGRISRINKFKPQLVVSLHCAQRAPREFKGMNPVLVAPYSLLSKGLEYLQKKRRSKRFFFKHGMRDWFKENNKRSSFSWFLNDTSLYFTSYPLNKKRKIELDNFKGYRYNMVTWKYRDSPGWERVARFHKPGTRYSNSYNSIALKGKFWEREKSQFEEFRRDGGPEGFGGDNAYASYEIIRHMLQALKNSGDYHYRNIPGKSYNSVYILPLHVNAVSAFIELGYLDRWRDRRILTKKQHILAEGIAVGIYSLLTGLEMKDRKFRHRPRGKKIDLDKYQISTDKSYFDIVTGK